MNQDTLRGLHRWFDAYVSRFYTDDPDYNAVISTKKNHTQRVCKETACLCKALNLSQPGRWVAETAALFHDLGRFKQYQTYRTFSDSASESHAMLSVRELGRHKILSNLKPNEKRMIAFAIAHHNALHLPNGQNTQKLFYLKLLRDADKLDIWRLVSDYLYESSINPNARKRDDITVHISTAPGCSPAVVEAFRAQRLIHFMDVKTFDDYKLLAIGWVYDLNFLPSVKRLQKQRYIEKIAQTLPKTQEIQSAVNQTKGDVDRMIRKGLRPQKSPSASDLNR